MKQLNILVKFIEITSNNLKPYGQYYNEVYNNPLSLFSFIIIVFIY